MKTITCPSKEVPVIAETQVLVVGSGPAGISAAVASARCGAKTMLVERYGCFGGALFVGQVESYTWYFNKNTYTAQGMMLSRLVDTFFSRTSWTMLLYAENHSISVA